MFLALLLINAGLCGVMSWAANDASATPASAPGAFRHLHTYVLRHDGTPDSYDEALAVASLQGIINRSGPELYILSPKNPRPAFWLEILSKEDRWLDGRVQKPIANLDALIRFAGSQLKGVVIWDPAVPASANVATTIAGVHDAIVLSPSLAERVLERSTLPVLKDLRGMFTGAETGSSKNDAYRWAVREYLAKGRCSSRFLFLFEDSFSTRAKGNLGYVVTRDWAVKNRAFVFDLSPWGDEHPSDDPEQRLGLDLETYRMILDETLRLSAGRHMTELAGFFSFSKYSNVPGHASAHDPVPTEWETVWLISPFNFYQNTVANDCFNQSLHSQAPRVQLKQGRVAKLSPLENKVYLCILMADYDSVTPLYDFLPNHWHNKDRGLLPLAWGLNPNLLETYPDLIAYFYGSASPNDTFTSDASAAGYMNPNRILPEHLPLFVRHNESYFREADMDVAPMVLDWDQPTAAVKDAFQKFSPAGFATLVQDMHGGDGRPPEAQVWKGMPVTELINNACDFADAEKTAGIIAKAIKDRGSRTPGFYFFRVVWVSPTEIVATLAALRRLHPEINFEVHDPHTFFALLKQSLER